MSSYRVLAEISRGLKALLSDAFSEESQLKDTEIVFENPTKVANQGNQLSIWLYHIEQNEFLRNGPLQRVDSPTPGGRPGYRPPPLTLDLNYLITPTTLKAEVAIDLLGKTMQALHENGTLHVVNADEDVHETLNITFDRLGLRELSGVWEALHEPYRLSVCYKVGTTRIDSSRNLELPPIREEQRDYGNRNGKGVV